MPIGNFLEEEVSAARSPISNVRQANAMGSMDMPRFQSIPGRKPLLGAGAIPTGAKIIVTEGVFDALILWEWGYDAVALAGNGNIESMLAELRRVKAKSILLALDSDDKTAMMQEGIVSEIECPVRIVTLPAGVGDVGDLATMPDGRERFEIATLEAQVPTKAEVAV